NVDREEHSRTAGEVLDVLITAVLPWRNGPCTARSHSGSGVACGVTGQYLAVVRWQCQWWYSVGIRRDQCPLPVVPTTQQPFGRRDSHDSGVGDGGETDAGDVP